MKTCFTTLLTLFLGGSLACATPSAAPVAAAGTQPPAKPGLSEKADAATDRVRVRKPAPVDYKAEAQARSHQSVGVHYLGDGKVALAIRELRAAVELNPADKWIQLALAEAYRRKGLIEDAEYHLLVSLAIDPAFQEAKLTLSGLYVQAERYEEAITYAKTLIADPTFPNPWLALTNQGYAEMQLGDRAAARESLELAIEYHDRYWRAILNLAILDAEEGNTLDAIRRLETVAELSPGPLGVAEANYRMGEIYVGFGNRARAIEHFSIAATERYAGTWGKRSEDYLKRLR